MLDKDKAVVVFSGGQDSTTCLYWAKKRFKTVYALSYRYGQKHINEVDQALKLASSAGVSIDVIDLDFLRTLSSGCSLTDFSIRMDSDQATSSPPNTFVPGRNLFFISIAAIYAREHNAMNIVTGVSQTDFSGYPDCRDNFIRSLNVSLNLGIDEQFVIHTPLMWLDKCETWALSDELGIMDIILNDTITCYNGIPGKGCGACPSCKLRNAGLQKYLEIKKQNNG